MNMPVITELDAARLRELAQRAGHQGLRGDALEALSAFLAGEAVIVPRDRIPADVVTVNSRVTFRDEATGSVHTVTVVYPHDFSPPERRISVLSPVGRALLGRRVGESAVLDIPDGPERHIRILRLHYQPEAAGDDLL